MAAVVAVIGGIDGWGGRAKVRRAAGTCGVRRGCCLGLGKIPDFGRFWAKCGPKSCTFRINSPRKKVRLSPEFFHGTLLLVKRSVK